MKGPNDKELLRRTLAELAELVEDLAPLAADVDEQLGVMNGGMYERCQKKLLAARRLLGEAARRGGPTHVYG